VGGVHCVHLVHYVHFSATLEHENEYDRAATPSSRRASGLYSPLEMSGEHDRRQSSLYPGQLFHLEEKAVQSGCVRGPDLGQDTILSGDRVAFLDFAIRGQPLGYLFRGDVVKNPDLDERA
jgi:hypothetical protein